MRKKTIMSVLFLLINSIALFAQNTSPAMADALRKDGKIYVVVLVIATIFVGIFAFLVYLERKISKLENNK
jgi:heme/copper-type cytochrome/quinol oxidase subunit 2